MNKPKEMDFKSELVLSTSVIENLTVIQSNILTNSNDISWILH